MLKYSKGLLHNKNAQHGKEKKSAILNVRVTKNEKKAWQAQAMRENMTLSLWVEFTLNSCCKSEVEK